MYQELSRREGVSAISLTLWILAAACVLIALNTLLYRFGANSAGTDFIIIAVSALGMFALIKKNLVSYKYCIIDDEFIVHEVVGSKEKRILNLNVSQITAFGRTIGDDYTSDKQKDYASKKRLYNCSNKSNRHYIVFEDHGDQQWFTFQPSDRMIDMIIERMPH